MRVSASHASLLLPVYCLLSVSVKLLHLNPLSPSVSLSQSSGVLTTSLSVSREHPGVRVILGLVARAVEGLADQGATILHIATGLLRVHYECLVSPHASSSSLLPTPVVLAGHQLALQWCLDFLTPDYPTRQQAAAAAGAATLDRPAATLPHPVASIQLSNLPTLLAVIRSQLASKQPLLQLNDADRHFLSVLTLQTFLQGLQRPASSGSGGGTGFASNIRIQELPVGGAGVQRSSLFEGTVLDIPLPIHRRIAALSPQAPNVRTSSLHRYVHLRVVLYDINLTFAESEHFSRDIGVRQVDEAAAPHTDSSQRDPYEAQLHILMRTLRDRWHGLGVTLVACQKVIHPYLKQLCLERGILPLERLSIRHMESVKQAAGGDILSGIAVDQVQAERLGALACLEERLIGRRRYLFLTPAAAGTVQGKQTPAGVTTLLLAAATAAQQTELSALLQRVFKILTHMLRAPAVCAGAGSTEMQLAAHIRRKVAERQVQLAVTHARPLSPVAPLASCDAAGELAALEHHLRHSHSRRTTRSDDLLSAACLQVAAVLEDVACFPVWNSSRMERPDGQQQGAWLLEEIKEHMRALHEDVPKPTAARSSVASSSKNSASSIASMRQPTAHTPRPAEGVTESTVAPAATPQWALAEDQPLPDPDWHTESDWRLRYESTHVDMGAQRSQPPRTAAAPSSSTPVRDPHCLYGFSMHGVAPSVVWRTHPTQRTLLVDAASVLDPLYAKRSALQVAIEAASVLLRVDQIVHPQV